MFNEIRFTGQLSTPSHFSSRHQLSWISPHVIELLPMSYGFSPCHGNSPNATKFPRHQLPTPSAHANKHFPTPSESLLTPSNIFLRHQSLSLRHRVLILRHWSFCLRHQSSLIHLSSSYSTLQFREFSNGHLLILISRLLAFYLNLRKTWVRVFKLHV